MSRPALDSPFHRQLPDEFLKKDADNPHVATSKRSFDTRIPSSAYFLGTNIYRLLNEKIRSVRPLRKVTRMPLSRVFRFVLPGALFALSASGIARAQFSEIGSIFEIDPAVALNGFALLAGAIVVLFEVYRSRP